MHVTFTRPLYPYFSALMYVENVLLHMRVNSGTSYICSIFIFYVYGIAGRPHAEVTTPKYEIEIAHT